MENEDQIEEFVRECIEKDENSNNKIRVSDVYQEYKIWCEKEKYDIMSDRIFNKLMQKDIKKEKSGGNMYFYGIKIKVEIPAEKTENQMKEYIKFKDCCLHVPTFICIKETPNMDYITTNTTELKTIKKKLLQTKYFTTPKECCDFYMNLEKELPKLKIKDDLKIASIIFFTGAIYAKYYLGRGLLICDTYEEFKDKVLYK